MHRLVPHHHKDLCKDSDMDLYYIFISNLKRDRLEGWTVQWLKDCLDDHSWSVVVSGSMCRWGWSHVMSLRGQYWC